MNMKKHYKLYKSGKLWVTAAIATLALTTGMAVATTNAAAATGDQPQSQPQAQGTNNNSSAGTPSSSANSSSSSKTDSSAPASSDPAKPAQPADTGKKVINTVTVTRTINYVTETQDGKTTTSSSSQTATFTRTDMVYKDTTKNKPGTWVAASGNSQLSIPVLHVQAKKGYVIQVDKKFTDEVPALALTADELDKALKNNAHNGTITEKPVTVTYVLATKSQSITPTADNQKTNVYDNSKKADDKANQQAVWKAVTRTIQMVSIQGGAAQTVTQTVWYNRNVKISTTIDAEGKQTQKYEATAWQLAKGQKAVWPEYQIAQITGFHSLVDGKQQIIIPAQDVKSDTADATINVTFDNEANDPVNSDVDLSLHGNWGYLDSQPTVNGSEGTIHVNGWNATNDSRKRNYHYIFILDYGPNANPWGDTRYMPFREVGRVLVQNEISRPDVKAVHNVWNAGRSGFDVNVPINFAGVNPGDKLAVMMRWTSDPAGNPSNIQNDNSEKGSADLFSNLFSIDYGTNVGNLDTMGIENNQLHVSGWHASNSALGNRSHHFLILWDQTLGHEVKRIEVNDSVDRPDVAKVFPGLLNAGKSGYSADFSLQGLDLSHNFIVISRYSDSATGEGSNLDYWSEPKSLLNGMSAANQANLDSVNLGQAGSVHVAGWHATNVANSLESHQYLILWDATAGKQAASMAVDSNSRPDVEKVFPYFTGKDAKYGFDATFANVQLIAGHHYDLVSRFSTSNNAKSNGDDGTSAFTDYWFNNVIVMDRNQQAYHIDNVQKDDQGNLIINGWMAADYSQAYPNAYILLMSNATGREVKRQKVELSSRSDVPANGMNWLYNSSQSGISNFNFTLNADQQKLLQQGSFYFILRFSDNDQSGEGQYVQQSTGSFNYNALAVKKDESAKTDDGKGQQSNQSNHQAQQPANKDSKAGQNK